MLMKMELPGIRYDVVKASDLFEEEIQPELLKLTGKLQALVENPLLNPGSPQQIAHLFYDTWGIDHALRRRPDMGRSVDNSARTEIRELRYSLKAEAIEGQKLPQLRHKVEKFAVLLDRYAKLKKQASTYITGMVEHAVADPEHRIYTNLNFRTVTGRLSSKEPNLQNITREKEDLPKIRRLFLPSEGRVFVSGDYSQAELRVIAVLSGDPELTRIYNEGLICTTSQRSVSMGRTIQRSSVLKPSVSIPIRKF